MHSGMIPQNSFEIIIGTYEQYLLGYKVQNIVNEYKIEKSFATHSHVASIRNVASSKYHLASASADETVCLYDMRYRRESGKLMHHKDTINCLVFTPEGSHLFSCSNDGSITAVRCGNWQLEKVWPTAHKGMAVNTLAIHPTGKLALSSGEDGVLRTWNLIKGRQAYAINLMPKLKSNAKWVTVIKWSPSGEKYLLAVDKNIYIYSVETAGVDREITFDSKVVCVDFFKDNLIVVGFENGDIKFCDVETSVCTLIKISTKAHNMRVKCIAHMDNLFVSASSSGEIKLWKYNHIWNGHSLDMLQTVNCGARITCLSLAQIYKDINELEETKLKEEEEVKKKIKLRLKQEVIIDREEDLEVVNSKNKVKEKKHKKKRAAIDDECDIHLKKKIPKMKETNILKKKRDLSLEQMEDNVEKPKKKKKLIKTTETNPSNKKRKESSFPPQTSPAKKIKKSNKIFSLKKHKTKLSEAIDKDISPRKIKKKINTKKTIVTKKKQKKIR